MFFLLQSGLKIVRVGKFRPGSSEQFLRRIPEHCANSFIYLKEAHVQSDHTHAEGRMFEEPWEVRFAVLRMQILHVTFCVRCQNGKRVHLLTL